MTDVSMYCNAIRLQGTITMEEHNNKMIDENTYEFFYTTKRGKIKKRKNYPKKYNNITKKHLWNIPINTH